MLGGGASMWDSMASWSTPTVLFCLLNLMIATIFISSNFKSSNHHHPVNSPNSQTITGYNSVSQPPSLLQRVQSIDFSFLTESTQLGNSVSQLARVPSFFDRVKSFKLTTPFTSDEHSDVDPHHDSVDDRSDTVTRGKTEKSGVTPGKKSPGNLTKSSSEKRVVESDDGEEDVDRRRPATMKASVRVHDESVDEKADDFIKRFKQQLKLQRIDSLQRFREMLNRGTSSS